MERIETLAPYVSPPVLRQVMEDPTLWESPRARRRPGVLLFTDVAGFTPLAEKLAEYGSRGTEELTHLLNRCFGSMVEVIARWGGDVIKFNGDALTSVLDLPGIALPELAGRALSAARGIHESTASLAELATTIGPVRLSVRTAIGVGDLLACQVGGIGERWEYVLAGDPLRQIGVALCSTPPNGIVCSPELAALGATPLRHPGHVDPLPEWSEVVATERVARALRRFVPEPALEWIDGGLDEWLAVLRPMTVVFVGLEGFDYTQDSVVVSLHESVRIAQEVISDLEGTLRQVAVDDKGTVLLALFGAHHAHEDDAARAVVAARRIVARLKSHRRGGAARAGVATGQVFAGPVGNRRRKEYAAVGPSVNLAARLMSLAEGEGVLVDHETARRAEPRIAFGPVRQIAVKGKSAPVSVCAPADAAPHATRRTESPAVMIGRDSELSSLLEALDAVGQARPGVLLIIGEAGIGKSRLVEQWVGLSQARGCLPVCGAGQSIERQTPYRAWRDVLTSLIRHEVLDCCAERDAAESVVRKDARLLIERLCPEHLSRAPLLNDILPLGIPETSHTAALDPALRHENVLLLMTALLRATASVRPLLIVLDDAHWLDSLSWELMERVARIMHAESLPMVLVAVMRPPFEDAALQRRVDALQCLDTSSTLHLGALSPSDTTRVAAGGLGVSPDGLPEEVARLVESRADGNPFFALEMVYALRDAGAIVVRANERGGSCSVSPAFSAAVRALPATLHGLIISRIDRLAPDQQLVLRMAAVIGRLFAYRPLEFAILRHIETVASALRAKLVEIEIHHFVAQVTPEPDLSYVFNHIITQEVAYQTLLFEQRQKLHATVATWYEVTFAGGRDTQDRDFGEADVLDGETTLAPYYAILAYHYGQAADEAKERYYAERAGMRAAEKFANEEALSHVGRALDLTPLAEYESRFRLLSIQNDVHARLGRRDEQDAGISAMWALADQHDVPNLRAETLLRRAWWCEQVSRFEESEEAAAEVIRYAEEIDDARLLSEGLLACAVSLRRRSDYRGAEARLQEALRIAHRYTRRDGGVGLPSGAVPGGSPWRRWVLFEARTLRAMALLVGDFGDYERAIALCREATELSRRVGDPTGEACDLGNVGLMLHRQDRHSESLSYMERALELCRDIGYRVGEKEALLLMGLRAQSLGNPSAARSAFDEALRIVREIGDRRAEENILNNLAIVYWQSGEHDHAETTWGCAAMIAEEIGDRSAEAALLNNLGIVARKRGRPHEAQARHTRALEVYRLIEERAGEGFALSFLGDALRDLGDLAGAEEAYDEAIAIRRSLGQRALIMSSLAGGARVDLALGNCSRASQRIEEVYCYLEGLPVEGLADELEIYLLCFETLRGLADERAARILDLGHRQLTLAAQAIATDAARRSFLEDDPVPRGLTRAWHAYHVAAVDPHCNAGGAQT